MKVYGQVFGRKHPCDQPIYGDGEPMKHCHGCHRTLPVSEFYRFKAMPDGYHSNCKSCMNKQKNINDQTRRARMSAKAEVDR